MKETIDYSKKENWFQIPEITKDVDTFYNLLHATAYADATNVFMPYYRQCGMAATVRITRSSTTTSRRTWPNVSQPIRRM